MFFYTVETQAGMHRISFPTNTHLRFFTQWAEREDAKFDPFEAEADGMPVDEILARCEAGQLALIAYAERIGGEAMACPMAALGA